MIKRREFFRIGAAGALSANLTDSVAGPGDTVKEPSRDIRIVRTADVIVCGGGPAGFAAAVNAARNGAKTTLIEAYGCLGGVWTTGLLSNIIDAN